MDVKVKHFEKTVDESLARFTDAWVTNNGKTYYSRYTGIWHPQQVERDFIRTGANPLTRRT